MSQIEPPEIFISSRYTVHALLPRLALIEKLRGKGLPVWEGDCKIDVVREVSHKIDSAPLGVVLATEDYAEDTRVDGNTLSEIQLLKLLYENKKKPYLYVKMCKEFKFTTANVLLPQSTIYTYLWLPDAEGAFGPPPVELVEKIVQKYREITTVSTVTGSNLAPIVSRPTSGTIVHPSMEQASTSRLLLPTSPLKSQDDFGRALDRLKVLGRKPSDDEFNGKLPDLFDSFRSDIRLHLEEFKADSRQWLFEV